MRAAQSEEDQRPFGFRKNNKALEDKQSIILPQFNLLIH